MLQQPSGGRADRILAGKLDLLFRTDAAIAGGFAVAVVVAYLLRDSYPHSVLLAWLAMIVLAGAGRYLYQRRFLARPESDLRYARRFAIGTLASGLVWGSLCAGLAVWGTRQEFLLLTFVAAGMTAGAMVAF